MEELRGLCEKERGGAQQLSRKKDNQPVSKNKKLKSVAKVEEPLAKQRESEPQVGGIPSS